MTDEFGPRLRRERERRKISLASISANTKVSIWLFEALERDDLSRWPSGIFRRSFVRCYAEAIGLDGDEIIREFLERFPDPADAARLELAGDHTAEPPARLARRAALRLTLADSWTPFAGGEPGANRFEAEPVAGRIGSGRVVMLRRALQADARRVPEQEDAAPVIAGHEDRQRNPERAERQEQGH